MTFIGFSELDEWEDKALEELVRLESSVIFSFYERRLKTRYALVYFDEDSWNDNKDELLAHFKKTIACQQYKLEEFSAVFTFGFDDFYISPYHQKVKPFKNFLCLFAAHQNKFL